MKNGRTGLDPAGDQTFLTRICHALDEPPRNVAKYIGVPFSELKPLLAPRSLLAGMEEDVVWFKLAEFVDERLGVLMAIRTELQKATDKDRLKRAARMNRVRASGRLRPPPRRQYE